MSQIQIRCPACREIISKSARRCPECGYVLKPNWVMLIVGIVVILSLAFALTTPFLIKFLNHNRPTEPPNSQVANVR